MKKAVNQILSFLTIVLLSIACKSNAVDPINNTTTDLTSSLTQGSWLVSSYIQKTEDKTAKLSGYIFIFSSGGKVVASKNGQEVTGTWQYTPAVTYYGSASKEAIDLNFGTDKTLGQLTKKWNFISSTSSIVKVDSPELAEDEHLQFSKN